MSEITSPMVGKIVAVNVKAGDSVAVDSEAFTLESMKMELPINPPASGTVVEVKVQVGDAVKKGQVLAVVQEG